MLIRARKLGLFLPDDIREIAAQLAEREFTCYVVGGAIRDILRGKNVKDIDLATDATPEQVEELFTETIPTGRQFGTLTVKWNEKYYQLTTFRKETGYSDRRHPDKIEYSKDIREDILRRDFTINALAYNPINNELVDECRGLEDLSEKILRTVGDPAKRFEEDGLRVIRGLRFLSITGFAIDLATGKELAQRAPQWAELASKERLFEEFDKIIHSDNPDYGLSFLGWPALNELDRQVRWAAIIQKHPEVFELIQEKQKRRRIEKLLKYNLDLDKASMEIADLKLDGIDIMELGPRGEAVGKILESLLEIVIEKRQLNKKPLLLELTKDLMAGMTVEDILKEKPTRRLPPNNQLSRVLNFLRHNYCCPFAFKRTNDDVIHKIFYKHEP